MSQKPLLNIVGSHTSSRDLVLGGEVWAFNSAACTRKVDAAFQMHQEVDWGGGFYRRWLKTTTVPVYMRERHADIPSSIAYPFDDIFEMVANVRHTDEPLRYFTSSIAWAIALAVHQERPRIYVYGIELYNREYEEQKDCFAFWLGFAGGRGIDLNIRCADNIFDKPLYGELPLQ